ncbi:MAG: hypothetical protein H3Z54_10085 [archaeon]|nr:hypothetical protein [archaeon]
MLKQLFEYAGRERNRGVYDFTEIMRGFYKKLSSEYDSNSTRNTLTKRLLKMMKDYVDTDPRTQLRIDQFHDD